MLAAEADNLLIIAYILNNIFTATFLAKKKHIRLHFHYS